METLIACPKCSQEVLADARFCENCGTQLSPAVAPKPDVIPGRCRCGAGPDERDSDGFCLACGHKFVPPNPRDHLERELSNSFAAVTDLGLRHKKNEDAFAIAEEGGAYVIVVCDGVSSASRSNEASQAAADAARDTLIANILQGGDPKSAMNDAISRAHEAASAIPMGNDGKHDPPGTTFVAAQVNGQKVTFGWAGDSRAYWFGAEGTQQLTQDHSWLNEIMATGKMSLDEALKNPNAHAITQCLGPLNEGDPEPTISTFEIPGPGRLILCTDGLWGYAMDLDQLSSLIPSAPPLQVAQDLVNFAIRQGGRDNVTVAVLQIDIQP